MNVMNKDNWTIEDGDYTYADISRPKVMKIRTCDCGYRPVFYMDESSGYLRSCKLECANCGLSTINTAGFWYAHEYTELEAKIRAVDRWNRREFERGANQNEQRNQRKARTMG